MNRFTLGVATLAGVSTIALSLIATPAFAEVTPSAPVAPPTETLSKNVTVSQFIHSGVNVKFTGLTPGGQYQLVIATSNGGGPDGGVLTADTAGDVTTKYVATDPGSTYRGTLAGGQYTLSLWNAGLVVTPGAVISKTFSVKFGSRLHWNPSHRSHGELAIRTTAQRWNPTTEKYVGWHNATVRIQEKTGTTWKTVKTLKTSAKGVAKATIKAGKHTWRAVVSSSADTWSSKTGIHKR